MPGAICKAVCKTCRILALSSHFPILLSSSFKHSPSSHALLSILTLQLFCYLCINIIQADHNRFEQHLGELQTKIATLAAYTIPQGQSDTASLKKGKSLFQRYSRDFCQFNSIFRIPGNSFLSSTTAEE